MTLQRITNVKISNWRSWQSEATIDIEDDFVVFSGPNAIGKTSLWEAIVSGLLDKHRGIHSEDFRVSGSSGLIPTAEVEFVANDTEYRIRKRFSKQPGTSEATLFKKSGTWKEIGTNDEAFLECRKIVAGVEAGDISRGGLENAIKEHLLEVLLPPQGDLVNLTKAPASVASMGIDDAIVTKATIVGQLLSEVQEEMTMWNKARSDYVKSDLKTAIEKLEENNVKISNLNVESSEIDKAVKAIVTIYADIEGMGDASSNLKLAKELRNKAATHQKEREAAFEKFSIEKSELEKLEEILEKRKTLSASSEDISKHKSHFESELIKHKENMKHIQEIFNTLTKEDLSKDEEIKNYRNWIDYEAEACGLPNLRKTYVHETQRLEDLTSISEKLDKLLEEKGNTLLPDDKGWKKWDSLDKKKNEAKGRLEARSWSIESNLPSKFKLEIDDQEIDTNNFSGIASRKIKIISKDKKHSFEAIVSGDDKKDYEKASENVTKFLKKYDVKSIDELRTRNSDFSVLKEQIRSTEATRITLLDGQDRDELLVETASIKKQIKSIESLSEPTSEKPDGSLETWKHQLNQLEKQSKGHKLKLQKSVEEKASTQTLIDTTKSRLEEFERDLLEISSKLKVLEETNGTEKKLTLEHSKKALTFEASEKEWTALDNKKDMEEGAKLEKADKLSEQMELINKKQTDISDLEGRLSILRKNDPEGQLSALQAENVDLEKAISVGTINAKALLMLEQNLTTELKKHKETVGRPIQKKIQGWLRYILEDDSEIIVNMDGLPTTIRTPSAQEIQFTDQSYGTKEQISVLYRLAIANLIAENSGSGVCLMLDDPFGYTDKNRRERMLEVISSEAKRNNHQVIIFTCRGEDFKGYGEHISLTGLS